MILTDDFVFIHLPGTGGTFASAAIGAAYAQRVASARSSPPRSVNKHGTCNEIPASHRGLPIISAIRNPFDRYVSLYEYGWWKKHPMPGIDHGDIIQLYPNFPDLSFPEFVDLASLHFPHLKQEHTPPEARVGYLTEQFVRFYARDPAAALVILGGPSVGDRWVADHLHDVTFLLNHRLTDDLCAFLAEAGFADEDTARVRSLGRVHPARVKLSPLDWLLHRRPRRSERSWRRYYSLELAERVLHRERHLFALFPEFEDATP